MKMNSLHLGKALSAALFVLLLSLAGMKNALAQNLVATLKHGDDISFYYGSNALVDAHNAAETGDIITLSSGTFAPTEITKAITLRGAGCMEDTISGVYPTVINENIVFNVEDTENYLTVEGINFSSNTNYYKTLHNPRFIKCFFQRLVNQWPAQMNNAQFENCLFFIFGFEDAHNTILINCGIFAAEYMSSNDRSVTAFNSFIRLHNDNANCLTAYNCIICGNSENNYCNVIGGSSVVYNCIGIKDGCSSWPFNNIPTYNCMEVDDYDDVFEEFWPNFILKEDIATSFLGNDGTEVGLYGGFMPYTSRPSYQIVKHYSVPNKSDAQGHLNVGIELYSGDE